MRYKCCNPACALVFDEKNVKPRGCNCGARLSRYVICPVCGATMSELDDRGPGGAIEKK